jgi:hypothetical protein
MKNKWQWKLYIVALISVLCVAGANGQIEIGVAKKMADGQQATVTGVVSWVGSDSMYIQSPLRSAGIRVSGVFDQDEGDEITVSGIMSTLHGERILQDAVVLSSILGSNTIPKPLWITCRELGGVGTSSNDPPLGTSQTLKETGLLVRASGWVSNTSADGTFVLNDGCSIPCRCAPGVAVPIPGSFVTITGVSSAEGGLSLCPVLLMTRNDCQLHQVPLGVNLIRNPGAEEGPSGVDGVLVESVPGWTTTGTFTQTDYGYIYPITESQRIGGGRSFFFGGLNCAASDAIQDIDVSSLSSRIDSKKIKATLSGYLGGRDTEGDRVYVRASFYDSAGAYLGRLLLGLQTGSNNAWVYWTDSGLLPVGTRLIEIRMIGQRYNGKNMDSFFDSLSLMLTQQ